MTTPPTPPTTPTASLGISVQLRMEFDAALQRVTEALKAEGFGVLTEIDVKATLHKKLGVDFRPYRILGACNPPLAYRALSAAPEVGLLLPCNVTVAQGEGDLIDVSMIDPLAMMSVMSNPVLAEIADEAQARLQRVAASLKA
jgi:uncharacterized protein (DUF302 family)